MDGKEDDIEHGDPQQGVKDRVALLLGIPFQ
jgi:hypothetical protein